MSKSVFKLEFFKYHELLFVLAVRDIKARYKQTLLGALWAIIQPLSMMFVFTLVFSKLRSVPIETGGIPYPILSYTALLPWNFFATALNLGTGSVLMNMALVKKVYFPKEVLPIASLGVALIDFTMAFLVYIIMMIYFGIPFTFFMLWLPVLVIIQMLLTLSITLLTSALTVFFRDIRQVITLGVFLGMFVSPVMYTIASVPERFRVLYMLNPMAGLIHAYRKIMLEGMLPPFEYLAYTIGVSLLLLTISYGIFKRLEPQFADVI